MIATIHWPPPCRECGGTDKQQTEWSQDAKHFRQTCHRSRCQYKGDWESYPPDDSGYYLDLIAVAAPVRYRSLEKARKDLQFARALSLAYVPLRDRIDAIIEEIDDCLRSLRP